jgi:hypothetical protein
MRFPSLAVAALLAGTLASCNSTPVATMWALRSFDLATADLSAVSVVVAAPGDLKLDLRSLKLKVSYGPKGRKDNWREVELPLRAEATGAHVVNEEAAGRSFYLMRLTPAAAEKTRALQQEAIAMRQQGAGANELKIDVKASGCRHEPQRADFPLSAWANLPQRADYLLLTRDNDVYASLKTNPDAPDLLRACAKS